MIDYIHELYIVYLENNRDIFASSDGELKYEQQKISAMLSEEADEKLSRIQSADSERAFRCGFQTALEVLIQGIAK